MDRPGLTPSYAATASWTIAPVAATWRARQPDPGCPEVGRGGLEARELRRGSVRVLGRLEVRPEPVEPGPGRRVDPPGGREQLVRREAATAKAGLHLELDPQGVPRPPGCRGGEQGVEEIELARR